MKKIGIVTLTCYNSLGNELQNYALRKVLTQLGCQVDTIFIQEGGTIAPKKKLEQFSEKYLSDVIVDCEDPREVKKLDSQYDAFVVGSDQVWNCNFTYVQKYLDMFFLKFANPEKRISYAASFGISEIPKKYQIPYIEALSGMKTLSVREKEGAEIISRLCGLQAHVHLDPTMLLTTEEYTKIAKPSDYFMGAKFAIGNFLFTPTEAQVDEILEFCKKHGLYFLEINSMLNRGMIGVEEFLYALIHAEYVFTDSFHCTVFSILFHKKFLAYTCNVVGVASRITNLLRMCGLEKQSYQGKESFHNFNNIDFGATELVLPRERERSIKYLRESLGLPTEEKAEIVPHKELCCGCGACAAACPQQCITMTPDQDGFLYPQINAEACIHCERCQKVCPVLHPVEKSKKPAAYAAYHKNNEVRRDSSSGGIFMALAKSIIHAGGVVFGAVYGEHLKVQHQSAETVAELTAFQTSKYVQSDLKDTFKEAKCFLDQGRQTLFVGTPCQIQGLLSFLGKKYDNLLTADLICHGTPSPMAWDRYVSYREALQGEKAVQANFRSKATGWRSPSVQFMYESGMRTTQDSLIEPFYMDFLSNFNLRLSCYQCQFKSEKRCSDFTLADFWGVEETEADLTGDEGISLVLVHTAKGIEALRTIENEVFTKEVDIHQAVLHNPCALNSVPRPAGRAEYFNRLREGKQYV